MATANGVTVAEEKLSVRVDGLDTAVDAVILDNSPCNVLSLGKLCMERGFGFEWKSGEPPKLIMPDGSTRTLLVDQYVPVLASAVLPKEIVTEQEHNMNVAEAFEMSLPRPGGDDLIVGGAPQVVVRRENLTVKLSQMFRRNRLGETPAPRRRLPMTSWTRRPGTT